MNVEEVFKEGCRLDGKGMLHGDDVNVVPRLGLPNLEIRLGLPRHLNSRDTLQTRPSDMLDI